MHFHGNSPTVVLNQGAHLTAKNVQQWTHAHDINGSYHAPHHLEVAGLIERWKGLDSVWHLLGEVWLCLTV